MILRRPEIRLSLLTFGSLVAFAALAWQLHSHGLSKTSGVWFNVPCGFLLFAAGVLFSGGIGFSLWNRESPEAVSTKRASRSFEAAVRQAEKETRRREAKAEDFLNDCGKLFEKAEVSEIAEAVLGLIEKSLGADQGSVMLLNEKKHLRIIASRGLSENVTACVHLQLGERVAGLSVFERKEFLINGDLGNYPLFKDLEANPIIRSAMICPILYRDEALGVLNINRTLKSAADFTQEDLRTAMMLARHVGLAIHHARMCGRLRERTEELLTLYRELKDSRIELIEIEKQNVTYFNRVRKVS